MATQPTAPGPADADRAAGRTGDGAPGEPAVGASEVRRVCARFHAAIELIGGRWTGAILRAVFAGRHRFAHIRAAVPGLSDTMLAQRLRLLEEQGLLERRTAPAGSGPGPAEYHLTPKGAELEPVLEAVTAWAHRWIEPES
jgi:DNA-binding HxlR family transcriptional regulator